MRFEPQPNDLFQVGKIEFQIPEHPAAPNIAFAQTGRKSTVYQLKRIPGNIPYALKVFKPAFQDPQIVKIAERIINYATLPGMAACQRTVLTRDKYRSLIEKYPELRYAVLMPWLGECTWWDVLVSERRLSRKESLELARSAAVILSELEKRGLAHCDIAGGNVLLDLDQRLVFLVDVEDMYGPELSLPSSVPAGTAGYQHKTSRKSSQGQWFAEGDRFSGAVLLAEMLAWHDSRIRKKAHGEHYFAEAEMQDVTCERYDLMMSVLHGISDDIANLFRIAWLSETLSRCPRLDKWAHAIDREAALHALEEAIASNSDRQIFAAWREHETVLEREIVQSDSPKTRKRQRRVDLSRRRCHALDQLQHALASGQVAQLIAIYSDQRSLLEPCQDFTMDERGQVERIVDLQAALEQAIRDNDDAAIAKNYTEIQLDWSGVLALKQIERVKLALRRMEAYRKLEAAVRGNSDEKIVAVYQHYGKVLDGFELGALDAHVRLARRRVVALGKLRTALKGGDDENVWGVFTQHYDLLRRCQDFSKDKRLVEAVRRRIVRVKRKALKWALWIEDDLKIEEVYDPLLFRGSDALNRDEQIRVKLAVDRVAALRKLQSALESGDWAVAVQIYDSYAGVRHCSGFTAVERAGVANARRVLLHDNVWEAVRSGTADEVVSAARGAVEGGCELDQQTRRVVRAARRHSRRLHKYGGDL